MAARLGIVLPGFVGTQVPTSLVSVDLDRFAQLPYDKSVVHGELTETLYGTKQYRMPESMRHAVVGTVQNSYFQDYYLRIYIEPTKIALGTISSEQTRQVFMWNAYPYNPKTLIGITQDGVDGIDIAGLQPPYTMPPLLETVYTLTIKLKGEPDINGSIAFVFLNADQPLPVIITGSRSSPLYEVPESPVKEMWIWLSDIIVSVDGNEQRISLRGDYPKIEMQTKLVFDNQEQVNDFYAKLISTSGNVWVPQFQYSTLTTGTSLEGSSYIYFDKGKADVREGEYVLVSTKTKSSLVALKKIDTNDPQSTDPNAALLVSPLTFDVPKGSLIVPGSNAFIGEPSLERPSVNEVCMVNMTSQMLNERDSLARPGATVTLDMWADLPVLDVRPLADEDLSDGIVMGGTKLGGTTGVQDYISRWDYNRVGGERVFKVDRITNPEQLDYWKLFLSYARGQCRAFWMPTYRDDLTLYETPADSSNTILVEGPNYAQKVFNLPTHKYLEIETKAGIHRTKALSADSAEFTSLVKLETALPQGVDYTDIKRISYLLPMRLADDSVTWKHYGLYSTLSIVVRTVIEP